MVRPAARHARRLFGPRVVVQTSDSEGPRWRDRGPGGRAPGVSTASGAWPAWWRTRVRSRAQPTTEAALPARCARPRPRPARAGMGPRGRRHAWSASRSTGCWRARRPLRRCWGRECTARDPAAHPGRDANPAMAPSARVRLAAFAPFLRPHDVALEYRPTLRTAEYGCCPRGAIARKSALLAERRRAALRRRSRNDLLLVHACACWPPSPGSTRPRHRTSTTGRRPLPGLDVGGQPAFRDRQARGAAVHLLPAPRPLVVTGTAFRPSLPASTRAGSRSCPLHDPARHGLRDHRDGDVLTLGWIARARPALPAAGAARCWRR